MLDDAFRQKGPDQFPRGIDNQAVDANPSELSGSTSVQRPVWEKFVTNTVAQENNQAAVRAENDQIRSAMRMGETWKGADGKLLRKVGRQSEMLDAEAFTDHPVAGPEARKSLWDREVRTWRKDAQDAAFALRDPSFHSGAMTDKEREDALNEGAMLPETDPRHVELKSKLRADDDYRARKAELAQRSFDSEKRARELESTDPESWWSSRGAEAPSQQRAAVVADAKARAGEADIAADSATKELAGIDAKLAQGVRGSEVDALKARRAEIATGQAVFAQEKAKAAEQVRGVQEQAKAEVDKPFFGFSDAFSGIWDAVKGLGTTAPAAFYQLTQGLERPDKYSDSAKSAFAEADAYTKAMQAKNAQPGATDVGSAFREAGGSLGFSLGSMAAAIPASMAGAEAGAAIGASIGAGAGAPAGGVGAVPGAAAGGGIGGTIGGISAGMAASATAAYRMAGASFLNEAFQQLNAESQRKNGRPMNEEEMASAYQNLLPIAQNTALWEAGPEAVGNAVTLGAGKIVFGLGKPLLAKFGSSALGKAAVVAGDLATELGTETLTQVEQSADQKKMEAVVAGQDPSAISADWSAGGMVDAFKEVAPQTLAMMALMGGAGGVVKTGAMAVDKLRNDPAVSPDVESEAVATELAALDPEAEPPTPDEIARGAILSPTSPAEGVLVERELAQVEADDESAISQKRDAIQQDLDAAIQNGAKESTIKQLRDNLDNVDKRYGRAPLVRAVTKIAAGWQVDDLNSDELAAVGITKSDSGEYAPMDEKERAAVGISAPMVDVGDDGSVILTDGALKRVGEISPRARGLVKLTEHEARQKAKERAAQQLSTDTQNGTSGDPASGVFSGSEPTGVVPPHETNAPVGTNPANSNALVNQSPAAPAANPATTGGNDPSAVAPEGPSQLTQTNEPPAIPQAGTQGAGTGNAPTDQGAPATGTGSVPAQKPVSTAHKAARSAFDKAKRKLKDRLTEGAERATTRPDGITINPKQIVDEALSRGMTDKQAADYFARVLDEEIRHLAQYDAARVLYRANGGTGDFMSWMESHYAGIWQSDFVATGKDAIIRDLYAKGSPSGEWRWDTPPEKGGMTDGDKALEAIRMMSQGDSVTEQGKLWANISESLKQAITAALAALKQFADIASPSLKSEITNLENALKQLNQSRRGDSKTGGKKPAPGKTGDGTGKAPQTERDSGVAGDRGAESERRDGAGSPLLVGSRVEFTKNGKTRTGKVEMIDKGSVLIRPDDNPGIAVGVDVGDVRVISAPSTSSASTPEVENQTPTPKTPWPSQKEKEKEKAEKAKAASPADSTDAAGEQSPVALNPRAIRLHAAMAPGFGWTGNTGMEWARRLDEMISAKESGGRFPTMQFLSNWNNGLNLPLVKALFKEVGIPPVKGWTQKGIKEALENWASPTIEYTPEAATPTPTKEKPTLTEAEQALKDAFKGMVDGLEASPLGESYTQGIPPEKIPQFITAAQKLIADGVTSPEGLAAALDKISPKLRVYSEAVWSAFRMVDPSLPVGVDWAGIYASTNQDAEISVGDWVRFKNRPNEGPWTVWRIANGTAKLDNETRNLSHNLDTLEKVDSPQESSTDNLGDNSMRLAHQIAMRIKRKEKITIQQLTELATGIFGGKTGESFDIKSAYDAVEMAINLLVLDSKMNVNATASEAKANLAQIREWMEYIPTQTRRTGEMDALQQFSTPPHFSYIAAWVSGAKVGDIALEPSAGLGGLAAWVKKAGAKVWLNELSERRRTMLNKLEIGESASPFDAGMIHAITKPGIEKGNIEAPTVVVMNPPFSNNAAGRKDLLTGGQHIEEALKMLVPGGRLVAIVGEGMAMDAPRYREWWNKIAAKYDVRANIHVDGREYQKYGTTFSNRILVIDKVLPTGEGVVRGEVRTIEELIPLLEDVRNTRPETDERSNSSNPQPSDQQGGNAENEQGGVDSGDVSGSSDSDSGAASSGKGRRGGKSGRSGSGGKRSGRNGRENGDTRGSNDAATNPDGQPEQSGGQDQERDEGVVGSDLTLEDSGETKAEVDQNEIFSSYSPRKVRIKGSQPHPSNLVESSSMASVELPDIKVAPNIPAQVVAAGGLSDAQLEAVAYAAQAHETVFDDGRRQGFFIGDGTGVGKGREIAGIIMHNWREGRRKAVWISEKRGLYQDAGRDFRNIGGGTIPIADMASKIAPPDGNGVAFLTYDGLKENFQGLNEDGSPTKTNPSKPSRAENLLKWLGKDFDGVIALDEAHNAGNLLEIKKARGSTKPSGAAIAVDNLQKMFPNARIVYASATGATEPQNIAFADRLGLWGQGKAFTSAREFYETIKSAGISAMEIFARDLKSMGLYMARTLSFKGRDGGEAVEFARLEHELTPDQEEIYRRAAEGWQTIFTNMDGALDASGAQNNPSARSAAMSALWGSQQRFFNNLLTSLQMPTVLADMQRRLDDGGSVVVQLVNTNESALDRALVRALEENPDNPDLESLDLSNRQDMLEYINNSFPTAQFVERPTGQTRADGTPVTQWVPLIVKDADGKDVAVQNPEAVAMKNRLLQEIATIPLPDPPIEQIINHFGHENVAEITGRKKRVVVAEDDNGRKRRTIESKRGDSRLSVEKDEFLEGKRRVLIFSNKGGTGFSYHAGKDFKNQQRRFQYVVQPGWRADKAIQGLGRTHRADQVKSPFFILAGTNVRGHQRFISTIARRLQQLGALTSGERKSTGQGLFNEDDNLHDQYGENAVESFFRDLFRGRVPGLNFLETTARLGYVKTVGEETRSTLVDDSGALNVNKIPSIDQFLNRILALPIKEQNAVYDAFMDRRKAFIERAKENGTFDMGVETFDAPEAEMVSDDTVYESEENSSKTHLAEIKYKRYYRLNEFSYVKKLAGVRFYQNRRTGKIHAYEKGSGVTTTLADGRVVNHVWKYGVRGLDRVGENEINDEGKSGSRPGFAKVGDTFDVNGVEFEIKEITDDGDQSRVRVQRTDGSGSDFYADSRYLKPLYEQTGNVVKGVNENANYLPDNYTLTASEAESAWNKEFDEHPKYEEKSATFIVGTIIPVWHRIPNFYKKVKRVNLQNGESFLGVEVPEDRIQQTRDQLGASAANITPATAVSAILNQKASVMLSNGWRAKYTLSAGEGRIEIDGMDVNEWSNVSYTKPKWEVYFDGFMERIGFRPRFFLSPTASAMDKLFRYAPPMEIQYPESGLRASPLPPAAPFYSQLSRTIEAKMPKSATPAQVLQIAASGAKAEEVKWSGIIPWLQGRDKVSKDEVLNWLANEGAVRFEEVTLGGKSDPDAITEDGSVRTRYAQYTLPGGENYREVVLAMPDSNLENVVPSPSIIAKYQTQWDDLVSRLDADRSNFEDGNVAQQLDKLHDKMVRETAESMAGNYTSSHFPDVPNYVAHMRLNERTDAAGKPGLFIEELQSDRHQAGREKGYRDDFSDVYAEAVSNGADPTTTRNYIETLAKQPLGDAAGEAWRYLGDHVQKIDLNEAFHDRKDNAVPDAPYRKDWPLALFKRALRDAVASGKEWIGWTVGETQQDRFDLSKQVDGVTIGRDGQTYWFFADKSGENVAEKEGLTLAQLAEHVGKDLAEKASSTLAEGTRIASKRFAGNDLKVGGSGMKGFYDNILPKEIGKYVKQWGAGVQNGEIAYAESSNSQPVLSYEQFQRREGFNPNENVRSYYEKYLARLEKRDPIWRITITPEMRKGVEAGQALFSPPLPPARKVIKINRELAENTRDLQRRFGKNIASGKLASFGNNRSRIEQDIVDAQYEHERVRKTNEDAMKVAKKRLEASRADVEEKLLKAAAGEDVSLDAADEMAFRYLINERSEQAGDDIEKHLENGKLRMALRLQRADLARRMQIGYDRLMTPAERAIEALSAAIYTPSGKVERYAEKLPASKRQEFMETAMRERLEKVEKALSKLGVTLGQVTGKNRDLQLANSKLMKDINKLRNVLEQGIIKMVQKGASLTDIKRRYGAIGFDQAQDVIQKAREELFAKINEMAKSGMSRDQIRDALKDGLKASPLAANSGMSPDEIWKMIEEDFGLPKEIPAQPITRTPRKKVEKAAESNPLTSDWSRPIFKKGMDEFDFDTKDREGIMQRVEVIRGLAGALGKIDALTGEAKAKAIAKLDEINAILKKYGTDAAGIFAAAQGIEDYGFDVTDVAQVAAVSRAISMIDADAVDKASEWLYFSMLSGLQTMMVNATAIVPAAWETTVGRGFETAINLFFKDPMSAQLGESKYILKAIRPALTRAWSNAQTAFAAQHPMFDRDVLAQEIDWERVMGGKGYRTGGSISGKWGDRLRIPMRILTATDDFNTTLMACVEVGTFAARIAKAKGMKPGSPEFNSFIEKEVNEAGSFSYVLATEKAKSAIFSNPLPGQHDPVTGKKVPVNDLGDAAGYLAGKITDTFSKEHDNLFVKTTFAAMRIAFFPFQRTPFNILRKGVRYTLNPFSLFDIGLGLVQNSRTANGKWEWNAKGRNPELIRRMAMQMQGAVLMLLVAGLAEGDDDDQDKPLVITGSAPFSPRGQGERETGARSGLGPYRISFRRKDGSERFGFSYGRLEPLATTLAASVDIMKSIKRTLRGGGDASDAASAAMGGFVAQAQDKSFLRGVGDFTELVTNALAEPDLKDNRKMQQFLAGRVAMVMPNIIRQPIRESDSNFRERSAGFMQELLYQTVPTGQKPAKVDPYGQPVTKPGTALGRTIDVMDSGTNTVHPMDRMLLKFRDKHPDKAWFPSVVNSAEFTNRKTGKSEKMNPEQLAEFKRMAGLRLDAALKTARLNLNNPTERDIESAKELVQKSRSDAKKLLSFKYSR